MNFIKKMNITRQDVPKVDQIVLVMDCTSSWSVNKTNDDNKKELFFYIPIYHFVLFLLLNHN